MEELQLGKLIQKFRMEKEVEPKCLYKGLCNESTFTHYERGTYVLDNLLAHRFLKRMGVEADEFILLVSESEHIYFTWKEKTAIALDEEHWEEVEELLKETEIALELKCNKKLQIQYYHYLEAMVQAVRYENRKEAVQKLEIAIKQTIPNILYLEDILLSELELHMLMLYLYYGVIEHSLVLEDANILFRQLEKYIVHTNMEQKKQAKIYPKLICMWINVIQEQIPLVEQKRFCEKAIQILKESKTMYDITELLRIYVSILKELQDEKVRFYQKYFETFTALFEKGEVTTQFQPELLTGRREKIFLITEYLKAKRIEQGWTQEKLSENICTPEHYSRIETGKTVPSPRTFRLLAEKLGIHWSSCRGELDTNSLKAYALRQEQRTAGIEKRWEDALYSLKQMERLLDMSRPRNIQYVKSKQIIIEWSLNRISTEDAYEQLNKLFMLTNHMCTEEQFVYYSQTEMEILGDMAKLLCVQKKYKEGITLLEAILKNQKKSRVAFIYQWNGLDFIIRVLGSLYFAVGRYEDSNKAKLYSHQINLKMRDAGNLGEILDAIADNFEHMGEQYSELYKELYRQTYYVADFFDIAYIASFGKKYYEEKFDDKIKWY
ncbi:MAG: helix-turn-helix transcriptional regulator [Lachnospiraceae bacterium]|nr:helix-turn-helix transcriptional regulator [Lachnospiraceae bacterium]